MMSGYCFLIARYWERMGVVIGRSQVSGVRCQAEALYTDRGGSTMPGQRLQPVSLASEPRVLMTGRRRQFLNLSKYLDIHSKSE